MIRWFIDFWYNLCNLKTPWIILVECKTLFEDANWYWEKYKTGLNKTIQNFICFKHHYNYELSFTWDNTFFCKSSWSQTITPCEIEMIKLFSKHHLLCIWADVYKVRIFNLQYFVVNLMANSQPWQNQAAAAKVIYISSTFDRKEKSWARSDSKITDSLHYFIRNAQIGDISLFCFVIKPQFFAC